MATITKRGNHYRVQIRKPGQPAISKSFSTLKTAQTFAKDTEARMERGVFLDVSEARQTTLTEIIVRYNLSVLPTKKGGSIEKVRLRTLQADLGDYRLTQLTPALLSQYRDKRLATVKPATVKRELGLLSRILSLIEKEWGIHLPHGNPLARISLPKEPQGRDRRPTQDELTQLTNDKTIGEIATFAVETGMRRGEIVSVRWSDVHWQHSTLAIPDTKTGVSRTIPLSSTALRILTDRKNRAVTDLVKVFPVEPHSVTTAFNRACKRYGIEGLRFHDLRHEATSRFFELGLNPVEVASITGHRDTRMLMRYTHLKPESLVQRLG